MLIHIPANLNSGLVVIIIIAWHKYYALLYHNEMKYSGIQVKVIDKLPL